MPDTPPATEADKRTPRVEDAHKNAKKNGHNDHGHNDHGNNDHGHNDHGHNDHGHNDHGHNDHGHLRPRALKF